METEQIRKHPPQMSLEKFSQRKRKNGELDNRKKNLSLKTLNRFRKLIWRFQSTFLFWASSCNLFLVEQKSRKY